MGAWTSAFMIGVTIRSGQALPCNPVPINLLCNPIPQWEYITPLANDLEDWCACARVNSILRGVPEFSIPWPAG
jgi:hypothetical protein